MSNRFCSVFRFKCFRMRCRNPHNSYNLQFNLWNKTKKEENNELFQKSLSTLHIQKIEKKKQTKKLYALSNFY